MEMTLKQQIKQTLNLPDDHFHNYCVNGAFNVTNRAIGRAHKFERLSGVGMEPLEYALFLEAEISSIVNGII